MKKSLIALAVAGVVSAPAFAATSNVDIYGKLHVSLSLFDDQATGVEDLQVASNQSRIGFKGTEDLGGGLAAIWQVETGIDLDEQRSDNLSSRNSFVGLQGGFGTVLVGNNDTPLKQVGRTVDLFADTMADSRNVMGGGSDTRARNVVNYLSPSFSGLNFSALYSNDNGTASKAGDATDRSMYNLAANYANGPLYLGLAYGDGDFHEASGWGAHWRAAAGYTFGDFKVVGQYDNLNGNTSADPDFDAWMLGVAYTMGNVVLKANYMDGDVSGTSNDPKQWTLGADYKLSKRTVAYALYANGEYINVGGRSASSDVIGSCATCGGDISFLSVGMSHVF